MFAQSTGVSACHFLLCRSPGYNLGTPRRTSTVYGTSLQSQDQCGRSPAKYDTMSLAEFLGLYYVLLLDQDTRDTLSLLTTTPFRSITAYLRDDNDVVEL